LDFGFSWGDVTSRGAFAFLWPTLTGVGSQSSLPGFCLKVVFESRLLSEALEPLIGFLAYLEPKLSPRIQKLVKISTSRNANLGCITPILYMAITCQQLELEELFKPSKDS